jgi:holo-[acyl-carrier protein] synthase
MKMGEVLGTGVDLVENERMRDMLKKWGTAFKSRVFLPGEQAYCDSKAMPCRHYAGRFAVKEAVSKAFGTGVGPHISWLDMEVVRDGRTGAPSVKIRGKAGLLAKKHNVNRILISLSHTKNYAVAHALLLAR